jgi:hypothetical protein
MSAPLLRELYIRKVWLRPGVTAERGDPTPATWIDQPTLRLLGNEEALSAKHEREARARRSAERDA